MILIFFEIQKKLVMVVYIYIGHSVFFSKSPGFLRQSMILIIYIRGRIKILSINQYSAVDMLYTFLSRGRVGTE